MRAPPNSRRNRAARDPRVFVLIALGFFIAPNARAQDDGGLDASLEMDAPLDADMGDAGDLDAAIDAGAPPVGSIVSPDGLGYRCDYGGTCDGALIGGFSETGLDCRARLVYDAHPAGYSTRADEHGCLVLVTPLTPICNPLPGSGDAGAVGGAPPSRTSSGGCSCHARAQRLPKSWLVVGLVLLVACAGLRRRRSML